MLHERLYCVDHIGVLLVRSQVQDHVCLRNKVFVGTNREAIFRCTQVRWTLFGDGRLAERVGYIQATVAEVQALVETLRTTADDHDFLVLNGIDAVGKLFWFHETALAKFFQLHAQGQGVEVVAH